MLKPQIGGAKADPRDIRIGQAAVFPYPGVLGEFIAGLAQPSAVPRAPGFDHHNLLPGALAQSQCRLHGAVANRAASIEEIHAGAPEPGE